MSAAGRDSDAGTAGQDNPQPNPATTHKGPGVAEPVTGNYFVSTYPPFFYWSEENAGAVKVVKVNIDDSQETAAGYGVSSIPTLMVFKGGDVVERFVGAQPKDRIQQALNEAKG